MSILDQQNIPFAQAVSFINHTGRPIFLTGKAGTGKTTFLRYIQGHSYKKMAVVAPTGVAAINAGGSTLHSLFMLPFGLYLANYEVDWNEPSGLIYNKQQLFGKVKLTRQRRALLQELDLLVIDEVSMLRADALDAIDAILRWARRNAAPYGGVQMLFIGDLYQLPPVVKGPEQELLYRHYRSPFFFDAHVVQEAPPVVLELNKIYRQQDLTFIDLLNKIRNNQCSDQDLQRLNQHFRPDFQPKKEDAYITLTSHNYLADRINQQELDALPGEVFCFEAAIKGDFSENAFPTEQKLFLKEGAQIMFIKNDKGEERRYFNGKIGLVERISRDGKEIKVRFPGEPEVFTVEQEEWRNLRYQYDIEEDKISEETMGTFKQFPLRLAWAVTIHKSQGLTFDRAVIDAGASFAAGQVYVALSRLTNLEGLVLRSKITAGSIRTDPQVQVFSNQVLDEASIAALLLEEQQTYLLSNLSNTFFWGSLTLETNSLKNEIMAKNIPDKTLAFKQIAQIALSCNEEFEVAEKFKNWLNKQFSDPQLDMALIHERTQKAVAWFLPHLEAHLIGPLEQHHQAWTLKKKNKKYLKELENLLLLYTRKKEQLKQCTLITQAIREGRNIQDVLHEFLAQQPALAASAVTAKDKKGKAEKGETKRITLDLFKKGHDIEGIASLRGLTAGTVIAHLSSYIGTEVEAADLIAPSKLAFIQSVLQQHPDSSLTELRKLMDYEVEFHEIRIAQAARRTKSTF